MYDNVSPISNRERASHRRIKEQNDVIVYIDGYLCVRIRF